MMRLYVKIGWFLLCAMSWSGYAFTADTPSMKKLRQVADELEMPALNREDRKITFPAVPADYCLTLKGTEFSPVVNREGYVGRVIADKEVRLYFVLKDLTTGDSIDVTHLKVTVPGTTTVTGNNLCPFVIPVLQEWKSGSGIRTLKREGMIVFDPLFSAQLKNIAGHLAEDLQIMFGLNYEIKTGKPEEGEIYLSLQTDDRQLGEEGYRMTIDGKGVRIEGVAAKGVFWATRTLLQIADGTNLKLPKGEIRDYPKYSRRGFMLDVARKFFRLRFLQDYVKIMAYYKMNEFHIHLNDNGFVQFFDNDWDKTYAAFRMECDTYPGLTAKDGFYTKKEFTALQKQGMEYGVNIVPEIDIPAHSLAFTKYRKSLGSEKYGMDHLDLANPEIYPFFDRLLDEYLGGEEPVFVGPDMHIGTDEYAKEEAERFRQFTDHYLKYVQKYGKKARLWGALTHAQGKTPVTSENVLMNAWYNGYADPAEMIRQGYDLISTPDGWLYIVPAAGYYYDYLNLKRIYDSWEPNQIGDRVFPFGHPQILGGTFAVWNDHCGNGISERDVHHRAFPAMQVLAEKMWHGIPLLPYDAFARQADSKVEAPGVNLMAKVKSAGPLVVKYDFDRDIRSDKSGNGYHVVGTENVEACSGKGIELKKGGRILLPLDEIGYDYTVSIELCPAKENSGDAVLFCSPDAKVIYNSQHQLAFERDGYTYVFDYVLQPEKWHQLAVTGDAKGTSLYVNGRLQQRLEGQQRVVKDNKGRESRMYIQQTLVFPLRQIGDQGNGFAGKIKNLEVYGQCIY